MANVIVKSAKGFSKEEAAKNVGFDAPVKYDATQAYLKAKDSVGFSLEAFASEYINTKLKGAQNIGVSITIEGAQKDTRLQPYEVTNHPTVGKTEWKRYHFLMSGKTEVGRAELKADAEALAKELIIEGRHNLPEITIEERKVPVNRGASMVVKYSPSAGTKEGEFIFFSA